MAKASQAVILENEFYTKRFLRLRILRDKKPCRILRRSYAMNSAWLYADIFFDRCPWMILPFSCLKLSLWKSITFVSDEAATGTGPGDPMESLYGTAYRKSIYLLF